MRRINIKKSLAPLNLINERRAFQKINREKQNDRRDPVFSLSHTHWRFSFVTCALARKPRGNFHARRDKIVFGTETQPAAHRRYVREYKRSDDVPVCSLAARDQRQNSYGAVGIRTKCKRRAASSRERDALSGEHLLLIYLCALLHLPAATDAHSSGGNKSALINEINNAINLGYSSPSRRYQK